MDVSHLRHCIHHTTIRLFCSTCWKLVTNCKNSQLLMSTLLLMIKALDFWELFLNKPLWTFPVYWDSREKGLKSIRNDKAHLKSYYLGESLLILIGAGCSVFVILKQVLFPSSTISLFQLIILFVLWVATSLALSTALLFGAVLEIEYNLESQDEW